MMDKQNDGGKIIAWPARAEAGESCCKSAKRSLESANVQAVWPQHQ